MAIFDEEKNQLQSLRATLEQLLKIQPESLTRTAELGKDLNFDAGLPLFQRIIGLFKDLSECNLDNVSLPILQQLISLAQDALNKFAVIQSFSISSYPTNPIGERDKILQGLKNQWHAYFSVISPQIAYAIRKGTDFDALEREARGALSLVQKLGTELRTEKDKILAEMQGALEKVQQAAAQAGVAQHAIHFKQEADSYYRQGFWWLGATVVLAGLTIWYALYSLDHQLREVVLNAPTGRLVQLAISRIIVVSVLTFGVVWSARNFMASRHNFVVNRHRQNALSTFEAFVKGSSDPQTKDAVLLQATKSIFSPQSTGYATGDNDSQQTGQIIEVMRNVTGTKE